jgi:hypothetical protein
MVANAGPLTIHVEVLESFKLPTGLYYRGDKVELPAAQARSLIQKKWAKESSRPVSPERARQVLAEYRGKGKKKKGKKAGKKGKDNLPNRPPLLEQ